MKTTKIFTGETYYFALLCYCTDGDPLICGVFATKWEAEEAFHEVKGCPAKHRIKRCTVEIKLL